MTSEQNLLTQKFGKAEFSFEEGLGAWIMKEVFGYFLGDASFFTDLAVDGIVKGSFVKKITQESELAQGSGGSVLDELEADEIESVPCREP